MDCGYRPDDVYDMPWPALVSLTLLADDVIEARKKAADPD